MKIGFVIDDSMDSNDGVQQYVRTLGKWLKSRGHQVQYLAGQSGVAPDIHSLSKNIRIKFNGNRLTMPLPVSSSKIRTLLAKERYDVLHVQMPFSPLLAGKIIKYAPAHTAIVGTFHILPYGKFQTAGNRLLGRLQLHSLKVFDGVCFVSPAALAFAKSNYHLEGSVIPNMIDISKWKSNAKIVSGRIVFLGRLVPRKGCKELLLALDALPQSLQKQLDIIIGGDGPQRKMLEKLAQGLKLNISFKGYIPEDDKKKLLASAEIAVFPSLGGESFGIVLLEAMAAGCGVVVGGDNLGYRNVLGALPECIVDFRNTTAAAQKLLKLVHSSVLRTRLHNHQQQMIQVYDVETVGQHIMKMYDTALLHQRRDVR